MKHYIMDAALRLLHNLHLAQAQDAKQIMTIFLGAYGYTPADFVIHEQERDLSILKNHSHVQ